VKLYWYLVKNKDIKTCLQVLFIDARNLPSDTTGVFYYGLLSVLDSSSVVKSDHVGISPRCHVTMKELLSDYHNNKL